MSSFLLTLVTGLMYGLALLLTTVGLTVIFGVGRVVNFAHGAIYSAAAFAGVPAINLMGYWAAIVVVPIIAGLGAVALDLLIVRRLRRNGELTILLFTFGLAIVIEAVITSIWGGTSFTVATPPVLEGSLHTPIGNVLKYPLFVSAISLVLTAALVAFLNLTDYGTRLRAASQDPDTAEIAGINVQRAFSIVFGLGTALAALSGMLALPFVGASLGMGQQITVLVFIIVIVGGLGSVAGTAFASLIVGIVITLGATYASSLTYLILFAVVIAVLLARPFGLVESRIE